MLGSRGSRIWDSSLAPRGLKKLVSLLRRRIKLHSSANPKNGWQRDCVLAEVP